jgi:hypothetical protein
MTNEELQAIKARYEDISKTIEVYSAEPFENVFGLDTVTVMNDDCAALLAEVERLRGVEDKFNRHDFGSAITAMYHMAVRSRDESLFSRDYYEGQAAALYQVISMLQEPTGEGE